MKIPSLTLFGAATFFALLASACAPEVRVDTVTSSAATFVSYRTFAFGPREDAPATYKGSADATSIAQRMPSIIADDLIKKGYRPAENDKAADFVVRVACGTKVESGPRHRSGTGDESVPDDVYLGALVVDMFDARSGERTWHSQGRSELEIGKDNSATTKTALDAILKSFPMASHAGTT